MIATSQYYKTGQTGQTGQTNYTTPFIWKTNPLYIIRNKTGHNAKQ